MAVMTALLTVTILTAWVIAATSLVNQQARFLSHADLKSKARCQARTGMSRALARVNEDPDWFTAHQGEAQADTRLTEGSRAWLESAEQPDTYRLRSQARVNGQLEMLTAVLYRRPETDTRFFSLSTTESGQDYIAWSTANNNSWATLPPISGVRQMTAVTYTASGDVYALASPAGLWRFREGRGWLRMPDPPGGVTLKGLVAGGDQRVVSVGSDGKLMSLEFNPSLNWKALDPPAGLKVDQATVAQTGDPFGYVTVSSSSEPARLMRVDLTNGQMQAVEGPQARLVGVRSGQPAAASGGPDDFSGGLSLGPRGELYVGSNMAGGASTISRYTPDPAGNGGSWQTYAPIPRISWQDADSTSLEVNSGYVDNINHLQADDQGRVWVQWSRDGAPDEVLVLSADSQSSSSPTGSTGSPQSWRGDQAAVLAGLLHPRARPQALVLLAAGQAGGGSPSPSLTPPGAKAGTVKAQALKKLANSLAPVPSTTTTSDGSRANGVNSPAAPPAKDIVRTPRGPDRPDEDGGGLGPPLPTIVPTEPPTEDGGASDLYSIFSARPDFTLDLARQNFQELPRRSRAEQKSMAVGPGKNTGRIRYVPVAEI